MPINLLNNRYNLLGEISSDSLSTLYEARDESENRPALLLLLNKKALQRPLETILRFNKEIEVVSELEDSGILKIYSQEESDAGTFVVFEHFEGKPLSAYPAQTLNIDEAVEIILQLASSLDTAHQKEILHQSLQPQNILINNALGYPKIKLFKFGFNLLTDISCITESSDIISTFGYLSPEASGILRKSIDVRSDIYSLGIIFYQLLTGMLPYQASDVQTLIYQHIATQPKEPSQLNNQIPKILDNVALRLIAKDPEDRYQSLSGLIADLKEYQKQKKEGKEQIDFEISRFDKLRQLTFSTRLIGRDNELGQLKNALNQAKENKGSLYLVYGEPGIGKSRLIDELRGFTHAQRGIFVGGKCYQYEFRTPYKVFSEAIDAYIDKINRLPKQEQEIHIKRIKEALGELGGEVAKITPAITELIGAPPKLVELEPEKEKIRFLITITNFIISLAAPGSPLLLFLDDLQWVDEGSLEILERVAEKLNNNPMLLVVSYRDTDVDSTHHLIVLINKLKQQQIMLSEVPVKAFSVTETTRMISQIIMEKEDNVFGLAEHLYRKAKGNPFFSLELLRTLVEEKIVYLKDNNYIYDLDKLNNAILPDNIVDMVLKRVEGLSKEDLNILSYASVMGKEVKLDLLAELTHRPFEDLINYIESGIKNQLLFRDITGKENIFFMHDRIREAFYKKVPQEERIPLHQLIAYALEEECKGNADSVIYDLAHHFTQGQVEDKALQYSLPAAHKAKSSYANSLAIELYLTAKRILEKQNKNKTNEYIDILENLGETYRLAGSFEESRSVLKVCEELIPLEDKLRKVRVLSKMGDTLWDNGRAEESSKVLEKALSLLDTRIPKTAFGVFLGIGKEFSIQMLHYWFPKVFVSTVYRGSEKDSLVARILDRLGHIYYFFDMNKTFYALIRGLNLAETMGPSIELKRLYASSVPVWITFPWFSKAFHDGNKCVEISRKTGDKIPEGIAYAYLSLASKIANDPKQGLEYALKSIKLLKGLGEYWDLGVAYVFRSHCNRLTGRLKEDAGDIKEMAEIMKEVKAMQPLGWALFNQALLSMLTGDINENIIKNSFEGYELMKKTGDKPNIMWSLSAIAFLYSRKGEYSLAIKYIEEAIALFPTHYNKGTWALDIFASAAQIYLDTITNVADLDTGEKSAYLKRACRLCRQSWKWSLLYKFYYGWHLQVCGTYLWHSGKKKQAIRAWEKGLHWLKTNKKNPGGDKFRIAYLLLEEASFLLKDNPKNKKALEYLLEAKELFNSMDCKLDLERTNNLLTGIIGEAEAIESREALTQKRHLDSLLSVSKAIGSIFELDELLSHILDYALKVTGAERGFLFLRDDKSSQLQLKFSHGLDKTLSSQPFSYENYKISLELINEIEKTQTAAIAEPQTPSFPKITQELKNYSIRQAIAIPLRTKDKTLGLIYLDNRLAGGMFGSEELELMQSFAVQASISIENAFLVKEIVEKERLAEELRLGRDIQMNLLPKELPQIQGFSIDGLMLPAKEIGGDYYDFITLPKEDELAIVIGDVSGKGVAAGLLMAMAKTAIHTLSQENTSPRDVLLRTNSILYSHIGGQKFMTMLYFKYNPITKTLTYSSAGHEHILIYHAATATVESIISGGFMLGMLADIEAYLEEHKITLEPKDKVLLYTDGITDAENTQGERFGMDRLKDSFKTNAGLAPFELIHTIKTEVYQFIGTQPQYDDITLVGMEGE